MISNLYIEDFIYELDSRKNGIYMDADTLVSAEMRQYVYEENLDEFIAFQLKVQQELDEKEEKIKCFIVKKLWIISPIRETLAR